MIDTVKYAVMQADTMQGKYQLQNSTKFRFG